MFFSFSVEFHLSVAVEKIRIDLKTFLFNRFESRVCRLNGILHSSARPEKAELRQKFSSHTLYSSEQLSPKVDLRPNLTEAVWPILSLVRTKERDERVALLGAYEYLTKRVEQKDLDVSRLFIYYNARRKTNLEGELTDCGCAMSTGIETLEEFGVCPESHWPSDVNQLNEPPDQQAFAAARQSKISEALQLDVDLTEMKSCLAQGFPFAFGLNLFISFDLAAKSGVVPYSYMTNRRLCFDLWTIRNVSTDDMGEEHWDQKDSIDYHQQEEDNSPSDAPRAGAQIQHYHKEEDLLNDLKHFSGGLLQSVVSFAL